MNRVAIIGGSRTPFVKAGGVFSSLSTLDLGKHTVTSLVKKLDINPGSIDEIVFGSVLLDPRTSNLAREIVIRTDLPNSISAHSVSNNCITGIVSANFISEGIRSGRIRSGIAGGAESMSRPTLTLHPKSEELFISLSRARRVSERIKIALKFRPKLFFPMAPSPKEPSTGLTMGEHCEITTKELKITRHSQDEIAYLSHLNAIKAQKAGYLAEEIEPLLGIERDNIIRPDTTLEKLGKLPSVFDRTEAGTLTAGNSSALTDGASAVYLMSADEAKRQGREILGFIDSVEFTAINPSDGLLMAPCLAVPNLLKKNNLTVSQVDLFEIHEAFGAQVLANLKVWKEGWPRFPDLTPIGEIPRDKINVNGGSIAIGHPFAATGGRLLLSTVNELKRRKGSVGVISICAAGAMAGGGTNKEPIKALQIHS